MRVHFCYTGNHRNEPCVYDIAGSYPRLCIHCGTMEPTANKPAKTAPDMMIRDRQSFILGMEFTMRIIRNSAETSFNGKKPDELMLEGINSMIRLVQVQIGSGRMPVPNTWSADEI